MVRLTGLSAAERETVRLLLGRPFRDAASISFRVEEADLVLRNAGLADSLRGALEALGGPIINKAEARTNEETRWYRVVDQCQNATIQDFLCQSGGLALLKRLSRGSSSGAEVLCQRASAVLSRLPANGISLAQLAAETFGDAHALDRGNPTGTLVVATLRRAARALGQDAIASDDSKDERIRDIWAGAGVLVNELARPVIYLNLPSDICRSPAGEPGYLSLRQLVRAPAAWDVDRRQVFVCENPEVVSIAASVLGASCAPMVCTDGMPAAAQRYLLSVLRTAGARLLYHGDFDWEGIQIANHVIQAYGAAPWRFGAADYGRALASSASVNFPVTGMPVTAVWDPNLTAAMKARQQFRAEEGVITTLLDDLASGQRYN